MQVKIIGGGIVGSYLGKKLGEIDKVETESWEKNEELQRKTCGGLISKTGLNSLDLPYQEAILNSVKGCKVKADDEELTVEREETQAHVLDMKKLKKKLREEAKKEGVKIKKGRKWKSRERAKRKDKEEFLVGADGAISSVAREKSKLNEFYYTYQVITETEINPDYTEIYMGEYTPDFFAWRIPLSENKAKIGIGTRNRNLEKALEQFIKKENIKINESEIKRTGSAPIPIFNPDKEIIGNKWALVGDAAGQVKATTGGGVVMGCKSAENLAKAIKKGEPGLYTSKQREINKDLKTHLKIRKFLNRTDKEKLIKKIKRYNIDRLIEEHGDMDHPGKLKKEILKRPRFWPMGIKYFFKNFK